MLTGEVFSAEQAETRGLINGVVSADALLPHAIARAEATTSNGPVALKQAKMA